MLRVYLSEESALLDDRPPELRMVVKYALPRPQQQPDMFDFAFNSEEEHLEGKGRFHEWAVHTEELQSAWIDALPPPRIFKSHMPYAMAVGGAAAGLERARHRRVTKAPRRPPRTI